MIILIFIAGLILFSSPGVALCFALMYLIDLNNT
jgi:hypothetical protein